ncbi:phosphatidylserine decarboxylase, partial [Desulfamplus magnetovallimortis]|uniref:phosphatidylserine decarboxylase n=1 Tax=Desulfamplus magnetovallimortis TaxID=1246637 RepID=UPI001644D860
NGNDIFTSMADSKTIVFQSITEATQIWIKNQAFTLADTGVPEPYLAKLKGGSVVIHRLSPNDFHRFWFPTSGTIVYYKEIHEQPSHSVQPVVVQNPSFNIFNTNKRILIVMESPFFGTLLIMPVGAVQVDTIIINKQSGDINKGEETGYFQYGGSTVAVFFEPNRIIFDDDLIHYSNQRIEVYTNY